MVSANWLVLARGHHPTLARMSEGRMIEVLAHVVFVEPDGTIGSKGQILGMDQIQRDGYCPPILHCDEPKPSGRGCREPQLATKTQAGPITLCHVPLFVHVETSGAQGTQQGGCLDRVAQAPQIDVRQTAFQLVGGEQTQNDVPIIQSAE